MVTSNILVVAFLLLQIDQGRSIQNSPYQCQRSPFSRRSSAVKNTSGDDTRAITNRSDPTEFYDQIDNTNGSEMVLDLMSKWKVTGDVGIFANLDAKLRQGLTIEPLQEKGFCNALYKVGQPSIGIIKIFSPLARARMKNSGFEPGQVDSILADRDLGPQIYAVSHRGILMEHLPSKALTEEEVHGRGNTDEGMESSSKILQAVAVGLARMHSAFKFSSGNENYPNMLWHTVNIMLSMIPNDDKSKMDLEQEVKWQRETLEALDLPTVLGHGDFKPSNVMVLKDGSARFLDLECAGLHYRAYDLAKFFRTSPNQQTVGKESNQLEFLSTYLQSKEVRESTLQPKPSEATVKKLQIECSLLLPMTWLEAVIFFECSSHVDAENKDQWKKLASKRMAEYNECKSSFIASIHAYTKAEERAQASAKFKDS